MTSPCRSPRRLAVAALALAAAGLATPVHGQSCGQPNAGDCCSANGTPACNDADCCNAVCGLDPFCCDTQWDEICAGEAAGNPSCSCAGNPACPGSGDCFVANGTPGCEDEQCCNTVCAADPFCCDTQWDATCVANANMFCQGGQGCQPACGKQNVECVNPGPAYDTSRIVGRLHDGGPICTAWIVAAPNLVMTNAHCVTGNVNGMQVEFNFECTSCTGGTAKASQFFAVTSLVAINTGLDFAILEVAGNPAAIYGQAVIDASTPTVGTQIYEVHHAEVGFKGYDEGQVNQVGLNSNQLGCPGNNNFEMAVDVIASQGASGSPIFSQADNCVMAICHCGPPCAPGFAVSMSGIWPVAEPAILAAGGTPLVCNAGPQCPWDLDGDMTVGTSDLLALLAAWGTFGTSDLLDLLADWGACP